MARVCQRRVRQSIVLVIKGGLDVVSLDPQTGQIVLTPVAAPGPETPPTPIMFMMFAISPLRADVSTPLCSSMDSSPPSPDRKNRCMAASDKIGGERLSCRPYHSIWTFLFRGDRSATNGLKGRSSDVDALAPLPLSPRDSGKLLTVQGAKYVAYCWAAKTYGRRTNCRSSRSFGSSSDEVYLDDSQAIQIARARSVVSAGYPGAIEAGIKSWSR